MNKIVSSLLKSPSTSFLLSKSVKFQIHTAIRMVDLKVELTAPNDTKYTQSTGLFIDNEWVKSGNGETITSINPT